MSDTTDRDAPPERASGGDERSVVEWVTLVVSAVLVIGVASLVAYLSIIGDSEPPLIGAQPRLDAVWSDEGAFYLPVDVANAGDRTASEVVVEATLATEGGEETAEFTVDFLAGGETESGIVVFTQDPRITPPTLAVLSFRIP